MTKTGRRRKRAASGKNQRSRTDEPREEGGPDEAATFIAEATADLARLARRHKLDMLSHLLGMAQLEAEATGSPSSVPINRLEWNFRKIMSRISAIPIANRIAVAVFGSLVLQTYFAEPKSRIEPSSQWRRHLEGQGF